MKVHKRIVGHSMHKIGKHGKMVDFFKLLSSINNCEVVVLQHESKVKNSIIGKEKEKVKEN